MSSIPDSLGAIIRACQTHYSNDSIAELEHSLPHKEEKNWGGGRVGILCYFAFFLLSPPKTWHYCLLFSFIPLKRQASPQPYIPMPANKFSGTGMALVGSWGTIQKRLLWFMVELAVSFHYHFLKWGMFSDALCRGFHNLNRHSQN